MNTINNKKIAIVGAGPGGLTLARLLQMNGGSVTVYERDEHKDARAKGATLDLHEESGLAALRQAGLMDAFNANYRPGADKMRITDKHGNIALDDHANENHNSHRPEIDRGPLQQLLLDSLLPGTVTWDSQFASMSPKGEGWTLEFKNGTSAYTDVVIAADGANSRLRPYITPIKPFYSGLMVVEGAVEDSANRCPKVHDLLKGGKIFAMGDSKGFIVSSKGDGSLVFYTSALMEENWPKDSGIDFADKAQVLAWFTQEYAGWNEIWQEVFENASGPFIPRPQYCMPLDQSWSSLPNLTMLGDAAHVMPPSAGEGVNMAMLDALVLSNSLLSADHTDTASAIATYEKEMLARFAIMGLDTLQQTEWLHSPDALEQMVAMLGSHN